MYQKDNPQFSHSQTDKNYAEHIQYTHRCEHGQEYNYTICQCGYKDDIDLICQ